jgi:hypothetical protein
MEKTINILTVTRSMMEMMMHIMEMRYTYRGG